jgi:hypothetical protein
MSFQHVKELRLNPLLYGLPPVNTRGFEPRPRLYAVLLLESSCQLSVTGYLQPVFSIQ